MGLDMYLYRRCYVKNWNHERPEQKHKITVKRGGKVRKDIKPERICYIVEEVAYWRKANQIHKWFVDNCQGGVDDCRNQYVNVDKLKELVDLCKRVLETVETVEGDISEGTTYYADGRVTHHQRRGQVVAQTSVAKELLPSQEGFFFGGTDYDEYYLEDLRNTVKQLEPLLDDTEGEYEYHSSW